MLVLSRRPGERILFPSLGVSIEVLRSRGAVVRLGIDAPDEIKVVRGEIAPEEHHSPHDVAAAKQRRHELRNELNEITLRLELLRRKLEVGLPVEADRTLRDALRNERLQCL
jgi:carbon storage regulator CsrA